MREIHSNEIAKTVRFLFEDANVHLCDAEARAIKNAACNEGSTLGKRVLETIVKNLSAADEMNIPICQDTGMAVVFAEIGQDVHIVGESFEKAVNDGVAKAYKNGLLRLSVVDDPLFDRVNTENNAPAVIHTRIVDGDKIKITALPKGFGSENKSAVKMMTPSSSKDDIIDFVLETVKKAGADPCPPIEVGVGIGGTFDFAAYLAKKALARGIDTKNADPRYASLEDELLEKINALGIGPQGYGGNVTSLGVNIEYYPTHIAGLPVAVNINCHVMRHKCAVI